MNSVDGRVQPEDGRLAFVAEGVCVTLPAKRMAVGRRSEAITLGIRPEDLTFVSGERWLADARGAGLGRG